MAWSEGVEASSLQVPAAYIAVLCVATLKWPWRRLDEPIFKIQKVQIVWNLDLLFPSFVYILLQTYAESRSTDRCVYSKDVTIKLDEIY